MGFSFTLSRIHFMNVVKVYLPTTVVGKVVLHQTEPEVAPYWKSSEWLLSKREIAETALASRQPLWMALAKVGPAIVDSPALAGVYPDAS